ncbi:MAG: PRC-barrel domain-containing protein, partial [Acidimicrobiales bacterium]
MKLLMAASGITGLPVVTVRGGEDVAECRDVIYSPEAGRLVGVTLNKRGFLSGRRREVLPADAIHAIGKDAVMIMDESRLAAPEDAPDAVARPASDRNVIGNDVLTERGVSLGTVRDLALTVGSSGEVVGYQIDKTGGGAGYIPLPAQLAVSGAALVVPDVTEEFVR